MREDPSRRCVGPKGPECCWWAILDGFVTAVPYFTVT